MKIDLTSKRAQVWVLVISLGVAALMGYGFVDFIQTQRTREVFSAIGKANEERIKKGEGVEAAESYVTALHAINADYTKKRLKPALAAYVGAFEEGLALLKAGKSTANADAKITAAHQELVRIATRHD